MAEAKVDKMSVVIVVIKRRNDYHAMYEGNPAIWGCGASPYSAVVDLMTTHSDLFDSLENEDAPPCFLKKVKGKPGCKHSKNDGKCHADSSTRNDCPHNA
jgi:hypothetical protein